MTPPKKPDEPKINPVHCHHERVQRIGIQESARKPGKLYLVNCRLCGTTLTTRSLRDQREKGRAKAADEEEGEAA